MKKGAIFQLKVMGVIAALPLLLVFFWKFPDGSSEWASWVQAFGSIGAIIGAIAIATYQAEANRQQLESMAETAAMQRVVQLKAIRGLLHEWQNALTSTSVTFQTTGAQSLEPIVQYAAARIRPVQTAFRALQKIPFHEVPQIYIGTEGLNLVIQFEHVLSNLEDLVGLDVSASDAVIRANECINNIHTFTGRSVKTLEKIGDVVERYDGKVSPRIHAFDL
ncbi:hypothetical protein [Achromobacter xylosoxidans]|uniref:hypothetical protein n=1 Tax=Alcaligenes xylosoxydans xylosoxydans TaxID=85698 RepID=UPI0007621F74|nr:hypothetical protein [Achromobacter xylosoxidans]KWU16270.1 hypothetical protein AS148_25230 [Achromobacter xylosoxidans]